MFVDEGGRWRLGELSCDGWKPFEEGRAWINVGGTRAFAPAECHSDWVRGAALGGQWGIAGEGGRLILPPRYQAGWSFNEERTWGNVGGENKASHGWVGFWCEGGRWALLDFDGREILPPTFSEVRVFLDGAAWVKLDQWGLVDKQGAWLIEPRFDAINWRSRQQRAFVEGVEPVAVAGKWGLIDRSGKWVLRPKWDQIFDFENGRAKVATWLDDPDPQDQVGRRGLYVWIDAKGKVL